MVTTTPPENLRLAALPARGRSEKLSAALALSSATLIVAIVVISTTVAIFSFVQVSRGFNSFIAQTSARKTARETLVATLDEEAALRPYLVTESRQSANTYRQARRQVERVQRLLAPEVAQAGVPATTAAYGAFERADASFGVEVAATMHRKAAAHVRLSRDMLDKMAVRRRMLNRLVDGFNASGLQTTVRTKERILLGGIVSAGSTFLLVTAAVVMETLRRRLRRRRAAEIEANIVEREKAEAAGQRADLLEAGQDLLEREIAERKRAEQQLAFTAFHDELTGLPNRALFMDRLSQMVARLQRRNDHLSAILFLDLDRFKVVNDSLGHGAGDLLLTSVARRLELCLRPGDTLARLGGDEFTILLDDIQDSKDACAVAERVLRSLDMPFNFADQEVFASASIGIAISRTGYDRPQDVLRDADIAMYRAKQLGRQRYELFTPELLTRAASVLQVQTDLRKALERDEFVLFYQPIVSLPSRRIAGFEALIRWQHPLRGLLGPDFIAVAEENGAIVAIGEWVLRSACRQMVVWHNSFPLAAGSRMNVNVSAKQLADPNFAELVEDVLLKSGLTADGLNLEITESVIMDDPEAARVTLEALRAIGVRVQLDDFGTGYSSLAYLHKFPFDALKIDRSFVSRSGPGVADPEIVATIIALAHNLKIDATIEGIETEQQLTQLQQMGCTSAQGYYFSPPVNAATAGSLLAAQNVAAA